MIVKRAALSTFAAVGLLVSVACTQTLGTSTGQSDGLTDPRPAYADPAASLAVEQSSPSDVTPTPTADVTLEPAQDAIPVAALLEAYLRQRFGKPGSKASWYDDVRRVTVQFNTAIVRTNLTNAPADQAKAERICRAVAQFPNSPQGAQRRGIAVQVYGQDDRLLASSHDTITQN